MKKLTLSMIIVSAVITSYAAKITVDNTPNSAARYKTLVAAVDSSSNGDTLLVYGSSYQYAGVSVGKKLIIIGSAGVDPEVSNENRPNVASISFTTGSDGSVISGFHLGYTSTSQSVTINNIGIYNNYFTSTTGVQWFYCTASNWVIEGNVFIASSQSEFIGNYANGSTLNNILVKNNYFESLTGIYYIGVYNNSSFTYRNNVFILRNGSASYPLCYQCTSVLYENNIFWQVEPSYIDLTGQGCANCVFNSNIIYNGGGGTMTDINAIGNGVSGSNNIMNQDPQFVSFTQNNGYTVAENYRLSNGSPGHLTGTDGADIGLYGANYNWENRKYPKAFPHQEVLNVINNSVPQGTPVNINLKARKATN